LLEKIGSMSFNSCSC